MTNVKDYSRDLRIVLFCLSLIGVQRVLALCRIDKAEPYLPSGVKPWPSVCRCDIQYWVLLDAFAQVVLPGFAAVT